MKNRIQRLVEFIKEYTASACADGVVVGMSGGKDSLVVAKLCTLALGNENVFGVILPNGKMLDQSVAQEHCELLKIPFTTIDISKAYSDVVEKTEGVVGEGNIKSVSTINIAPRLRMIYLYSIAGSKNALVANTSNLSEIMIGYSTKWGDGVGDLAPIADFTKTEVCEMGEALGLPLKYVLKKPDDGLSGVTDEEKIGFSYEELDLFIRTGKIGENFDKIKRMHQISGHKRMLPPKFETGLINHFKI